MIIMQIHANIGNARTMFACYHRPPDYHYTYIIYMYIMLIVACFYQTGFFCSAALLVAKGLGTLHALSFPTVNDMKMYINIEHVFSSAHVRSFQPILMRCHKIQRRCSRLWNEKC